ncbi:unnamed protein product [Gadus morhua 'NCC']
MRSMQLVKEPSSSLKSGPWNEMSAPPPPRARPCPLDPGEKNPRCRNHEEPRRGPLGKVCSGMYFGH